MANFSGNHYLSQDIAGVTLGTETIATSNKSVNSEYDNLGSIHQQWISSVTGTLRDVLAETMDATEQVVYATMIDIQKQENILIDNLTGNKLINANAEVTAGGGANE